MRLIDYFDEVVAAKPQRVLVWDGERSISYLEAQRLSRQIANALRDNGVEKGQHVALYTQNSAEACLAALGILRAGCVWATFDITAKPKAIAAALSRLDVEALFYSDAYAQTMESVRAEAPFLRMCTCLDGDGDRTIEAWAEQASPDFEDVDYDPDDLATLFSSGGTTGEPKGVMATHRCWEAGLKCTLRHTPHPDPVDVLFMPMTHVGGGSIFLYGAARGFTFVVIHRFEPEALMQTIQDKRVTHLMLPPTALGILLSHPKIRDFDFSSLKGLLYGSGPTPLHVVAQAYDVFGAVMITGFGQTETTTAVTVLDQKDHKEAFESGDLTRLHSCGRILPEFEIEIMDEDGHILPLGEVGEIVVRGDSLMTGYYKAPAETASAGRFGWHHTGDVGRKTEDGYLFILDRKRDMIISRGYKIFPTEVEAILLSHPSVRECAVVGTPHDVLGEVATAVIALEDGGTISDTELSAFCRSHLGPLKSPVRFETWRELPKSRVGKTLRHEIRNHFWDGRDKKV